MHVSFSFFFLIIFKYDHVLSCLPTFGSAKTFSCFDSAFMNNVIFDVQLSIFCFLDSLDGNQHIPVCQSIHNPEYDQRKLLSASNC